jgi:hypothetical protein
MRQVRAGEREVTAALGAGDALSGDASAVGADPGARADVPAGVLERCIDGFLQSLPRR